MENQEGVVSWFPVARASSWPHGLVAHPGKLLVTGRFSITQP